MTIKTNTDKIFGDLFHQITTLGNRVYMDEYKTDGEREQDWDELIKVLDKTIHYLSVKHPGETDVKEEFAKRKALAETRKQNRNTDWGRGREIER